jgi:phosphonoacetaldehyde hydrolase
MLYKTLLDLKVWPAWSVIKIDDTEVGIAEGLSGGAWAVGVSVSGNCFGMSHEDAAALAPADFHERRKAAAKRLEAAGAHYVIDSVADLMPIVLKIEARLAQGERP